MNGAGTVSIDIVSDDQIWIECDATAFHNLRILAQSAGGTKHAEAEAVQFMRLDSHAADDALLLQRHAVAQWRHSMNSTNATKRGITRSTGHQSPSTTLSHIVGLKVSFTIHLTGGVLFSMGVGTVTAGRSEVR